ncbi:F0F1 ATP synthase subunit delta [uncultured Lactobacillus sp.]|uniref:F0F1 ATP synthase subunit delta n=1 Tax=uncultured Lactobacillus sp. TaxID=153152 RepID=UPI00261C0033|nr:F0F1 ATP synthase subunit delta [uncultured Lactobacillus sp.]
MALSREEIASRYSKALFEYSSDMNSVDEVHEEMNVLLEIAKQNPNFIKLLSNPVLKKNEKEDFLASFSSQMSDSTQNFLKLLLEYGRFGDFVDIVTAYDALYNKSMNVAQGVAITAVSLEKEELDRIAQAYAKKNNLNNLYLTNEVDPSILGGVILRVGDKIIDGSIRTKLQKIREQLIENR